MKRKSYNKTHSLDFEDSILKEFKEATSPVYLSIDRKPVRNNFFRNLNEILCERNNKLFLRLHGKYETWKEVDFLYDMKCLEGLQFDPLSIEDISFLSNLPKLSKLNLGVLSNRSFSLKAISNLTNLETLILSGDFLDWEVLEKIESLEKLSISRVEEFDCRYLSKLVNIRKLNFYTISLLNTMHISDLESIDYLGVTGVPNIKEVNFVSKLEKLVYLRLSNLSQGFLLPDLSECKSLRRIAIKNVNGINNLSILGKAKSLEEFALFDVEYYPEEDLNFLENLQRLKGAYLTGNNIDNIEQKLRTRNVALTDYISEDLIHFGVSFPGLS